MTIRLKVKQIAEQKGISQTQLSRMTGMDIDTVRRAFNNTGNPTLESLDRFARALQVHPAELLEYEPIPPAQ